MQVGTGSHLAQLNLRLVGHCPNLDCRSTGAAASDTYSFHLEALEDVWQCGLQVVAVPRGVPYSSGAVVQDV